MGTTRHTHAAATLLLLSIATWHAPMHAQGVQIQGQLRLSVNRIDSGPNRLHEMRDNASRIGFRGREDLAPGLSAMFGLEMGLAADTGKAADPLYRHSYIGLRGGLGTLALGRLDSANPTGSPLYSQVTAIVSFAPNDAGATAIGTSMLNARNRVSNAIGYRSPDLGGFEILARGHLRGPGTAAEPEQAARSVDLGMIYRSGPLIAAVGVGLDERSGGLGANEFDRKWQAGARYSFGAVKPYVLLGTDRFNSGGTRRRSVDYWLVGAEATMGSHAVIVNLMARDVQTSLTGTRERQQLAYVYRLSKRTQLQAFYDRDGVDSSRPEGRVRAVGTGIRHHF